MIGRSIMTKAEGFNIATNTLGMEPSYFLAYAPVL